MPEVASPPVKPAAPPPPAPIAKPAPAAATPPPTATPPPAPEIKAGSNDDVFADYDKKFRDAGTELPTKPDDKPPEKPAEKAPTPPPTPSEKVKPVVKEPKELRQEYDKLKAEREADAREMTSLREKIAAAEAKGKDVTTLTERLTTMEKDWEKDKALLRSYKQEASPEFKAKYDEPFDQQVALAVEDTRGLQIFDESGDPIPNAVFDWKRDMVPLWQEYKTSPSAALLKAQKMFGPGASIVTDHLRELKKLDFAKNRALERERENWKTLQEQEQASAVTKREHMESLKAKAFEEIGQTVAEYQDGPEEKELADLRKEGHAIFDAKPQTFQQYLIKDAHIKHRVASFGPDQLKIQRLTKQLSEAKAELDGYRNPQPNKDAKKPGGQPTKTEDDGMSWDERAVKELRG
jgi:hypothetical protein